MAYWSAYPNHGGKYEIEFENGRHDTYCFANYWRNCLAASDRGTEAEAQSMVTKAVALIKSAGPEKAYSTFSDHPNGAFKDRDLYVFVYDFDGNCLAQGANIRMVEKNSCSR